MAVRAKPCATLRPTRTAARTERGSRVPITVVEVFDEEVMATPWVPTTGWMPGREPLCFFRLAERSVTRTWTQQTRVFDWGPWHCSSGGTMGDDGWCHQESYEQVRDRNGWPVSPPRYERVFKSTRPERQMRWFWQPAEQKSETWIDSRVESWRWPDLSEDSVRLEAPHGRPDLSKDSAKLMGSYGRASRGDVFVPLPDQKLLGVCVDGASLEACDEFAASQVSVGVHDVVMTVEGSDGDARDAPMTVHVMSRVRFGVPNVETGDDDVVALTVPIANRTKGEVIVRVEVTDVPPGWFIRVLDVPFVRILANETSRVHVAALQVADFTDVDDRDDRRVCSLSATVVTDDADIVSVSVPLPRPVSATGVN